VRSLRARLLAAFLLPALLLFAAAGWAGYRIARGALEEELGQSLGAIAAAAAAPLNGELLLAIEPGDDQGEGTRTFRAFSRQLERVRQAAGARRVFAFDAAGRLRVDAGGGLPVGAEVPELARDRLELTAVREGRRAASQVLFEGSDGRLYKTGYAPVFQGEQVIGAVGVEGSAAFFGPLRRLLTGYTALTAAALLALAAVALVSARAVAQPLNRMVDAALRIGGGDLETPVRGEATVEVGLLASQLEQMRRALQARDRQLQMMLAGVAHEVRNPLGGISLFTGLLAEELATGAAEPREHVARIRRELSYLEKIVEEFLTFAREQKLSLSEVEAPALLAGARERMSTDATAKGVTLALEAEPARLQIDEALLLAAIINLVQASPSGSVVTLRGRGDGSHYLLEVVDRGSGIAPDQRERIFEPFFTTRAQGTGLGLPLARKIAQAHRGELELVDAPGETRFRLTLPLAGATPVPPASSPPAAREPARSSRRPA
jgi:signal transduction histidine kinase